jgi:hypothetical protein
MREDKSDRSGTRIKFTTEQLRYLQERLEFPADLKELVRGTHPGDLVLSPEQAKELMGAVSNRLQVAGFNAEYDPTLEGKMLESIIDRLTGAK